MSKRFTRRQVLVGLAAGALLVSAWLFGPLLESYRLYQYPWVPEWESLQVVYLAPADGAPLAGANELGAVTLGTADEVRDYADRHGLDVLIVRAEALATLDAYWASAQFEQGTAFVGLDLTRPELGSAIGAGLFAASSAPEYAEPYFSAVVEKRVSYPNALDWLVSPTRLPTLVELFGRAEVRVVSGYFYAPIHSDLVQALEPLRLRLDRLHLVRP